MAVGDVTAALVAEVRKRIGTSATLGFSDDLLRLWLTRGQYDLIWRLHTGAILEQTTTVSGVLTASKFPLPANFLREAYVKVGGKRARRWNVSERRNLGGSLASPSASDPFYYLWHDGSSVKGIVQVADAASTLPYDLFYVMRPLTLSASVDPLLGREYDDLLVYFALASCREQREEYEEEVALRAQYAWSINLVNSRFMPGPLTESVSGDPVDRTVQGTRGGRPGGRR